MTACTRVCTFQIHFHCFSVHRKREKIPKDDGGEREKEESTWKEEGRERRSQSILRSIKRSIRIFVTFIMEMQHHRLSITREEDAHEEEEVFITNNGANDRRSSSCSCSSSLTSSTSSSLSRSKVISIYEGGKLHVFEKREWERKSSSLRNMINIDRRLAGL